MPTLKEGGKRFFRRGRKKVCAFCMDKSQIDYKDVNRLLRFLSERKKIMPKRVTSNCAKHQRELAIAIKRAREIGLLPYAVD
ncbi:MAG TPA: 30S ribosomal protein S18 [Atribacteraceae bacterium]|nr:30S ribosomal protein S18 [Atribacteraceae bacterium]